MPDLISTATCARSYAKRLGNTADRIKRDYHPVTLQAAKLAHVFLEKAVITLQKR